MAWLDFLVKKETEWVILWQKCACACVFVLICPPGKSQFFVVVGWIWTFWTPWCYRRGWREGNIKTFWLYAESYDSLLNDTRKPFTSKRTFPLVSSSFRLVSFDSCTPLPASNLLQLFWLPAADAIGSLWALFLLVALLSPYSHMHLHCHTWTSHATHISLSSIIIHRLLLTLTCSLFFFQGDDGEIGPRGLPGEPVSDHLY